MAFKETLQQVKDVLEKAVAEKKRNEEFVRGLGPAVVEVLRPVLDEIASNSKLSKEELLRAISSIQINVPKADVPQAQVEVKIPEMPKIDLPEVKVSVDTSGVKEAITEGFKEIKPASVNVPKPEVIVNVPPFPKIPDLKWPSENMPIEGWVRLQGVDLGHPLPVQLRDAKGNPLNLFENLTQIISGGGGVAARIVRIGGFSDSAFGSIQDSDGRLKVILPSGSSGLTDTELRASAVPVIQVTGSVDSVNVLQIAGNSAVVGSGYQDNALRVVNATDAITSVNVVNANSLDVQLVSGSVASVNIMQTLGSPTVVGTGYSDNALRVVHATDVTASVYAQNPVDQGDAATALRVVIAGNSDVSVAATQVGTWNITTVTGVTNSVAATIIDSTGIGYSGSNPVPITGNVNVNGALNSVLATGVVLHDAADDGDAPVKIGGIAMTANPTKVSGGDRASLRTDAVGRQLVRSTQVRELLTTAYTSLTNGTATTLLQSAASTFNDLVYLTGANSSDAAVIVDIRPGSAENIVLSLAIPANGTAGIACPVPLPQGTAANAWTADMPDITGTTVYLSALFSKEV